MQPEIMQESNCQVCGLQHWKAIDVLTSGVWNKSSEELNRNVLIFPIGQCKNCKHVQVTIPYTEEIFNTLYFSNTLEPDMWCDTPNGAMSPYEEMLSFFQDYIKPTAHIVDFGAGAGATLKHIEKNYPQLSLSCVDFHDHIHSNTIKFINADLNKLEQIQARFSKNKIDIAISTHVLEHIVNPVLYLSQISDCLTDDGHIFIEVPDCSENAFIDNLAYTNLVHGQHIHYYTQDSMRVIGQLAGLDVLDIKQIKTGDIPRLLILFKKNTAENVTFTASIQDMALNAVSHRFNQYRGCQQGLFEQVKSHLAIGDKIGLWGIGGDFYQFVESYPEIVAAIKKKEISLFDYELAGHTFAGEKIKSSTELEQSELTVFIAPIYAPTREKMTLISGLWSCNVIDPYLTE